MLYYSLQDSLDNITLFSIITLMSLFLMAPVTFFSEGIKFTPSYIQSAVSFVYILQNQPLNVTSP